jgi:hypothetical protein
MGKVPTARHPFEKQKAVMPIQPPKKVSRFPSLDTIPFSKWLNSVFVRSVAMTYGRLEAIAQWRLWLAVRRP